MKVLNCVALTIAIIGAINWGLIGFFDFNLFPAASAMRPHSHVSSMLWSVFPDST